MTKVLLPLDGSLLAEQAIPTARMLAVMSKGSLDLVLVHAVGPIAEGLSASRGEEPRTIEEEYLDATAASIARQSDIPVTHRVIPGDPVEKICASAQRLSSDLIVMTTHGRTGFSRAWIGSVADAVIRSSSVPVLLVRAMEGHVPTLSRPFGNILVPLDGSETATLILPVVIGLAKALGARVTLLQVVNPVPDNAAADATKYLTSLAARVYDEHTVPVDTRVVLNEQTAGALFDATAESHADLVAMTTQGRGLSRLLVGSVADKMLRGMTLPLLLLRPRAVAKPATRDANSLGSADLRSPAGRWF